MYEQTTMPFLQAAADRRNERSRLWYSDPIISCGIAISIIFLVLLLFFFNFFTYFLFFQRMSVDGYLRDHWFIESDWLLRTDWFLRISWSFNSLRCSIFQKSILVFNKYIDWHLLEKSIFLPKKNSYRWIIERRLVSEHRLISENRSIRFDIQF